LKRWRSLGLDEESVGTIAMAPGVPGRPPALYAGTAGDGSQASGALLRRFGRRRWLPMLGSSDVDFDLVAIAVDPRNSDTLYAGTTRGVFSTADGGGTWTEIGVGLQDAYVGALTIAPDERVLYDGTVGGVYALNLP